MLCGENFFPHRYSEHSFGVNFDQAPFLVLSDKFREMITSSAPVDPVRKSFALLRSRTNWIELDLDISSCNNFNIFGFFDRETVPFAYFPHACRFSLVEWIITFISLFDSRMLFSDLFVCLCGHLHTFQTFPWRYQWSGCLMGNQMVCAFED